MKNINEPKKLKIILKNLKCYIFKKCIIIFF